MALPDEVGSDIRMISAPAFSSVLIVSARCIRGPDAMDGAIFTMVLETGILSLINAHAED